MSSHPYRQQLDLAVIGTGAVSPAGVGVAALKNAPQPVETPFLDGSGKTWPVLKVDLKDAAFAGWQKEARLRRSSPISLFLIEAAEQALAGAGLSGEERKRTGVVAAFSTGSLVYSRRFFEAILRQGRKAASPALFPETVFNSPLSHVAATLGLGGAAYALVGDETAWIAALKTAWLWLRQGEADQVLVLGAEEFDAVILDTYRAAGWLGKKSSLRPSEGAGAVLVRAARAGEGAVIAAGTDGQVYRNRHQLETAGKQMLADQAEGALLFQTATRQGTKKIEEALAPRFRRIDQDVPYLGEAFAASASWQTLRALALGKTDGPLLVPVWGSNHQIGLLELK